MRILLCLLLAGCASTPSTAFLTSLHDAGLVNDGLIIAGTQAVKSGAITSTQATRLLAVTDQVNALLTAANAAYVAGNMALANTDLTSASTKATATKACLSPGTAVDTCLTSAGAP